MHQNLEWIGRKFSKVTIAIFTLIFALLIANFALPQSFIQPNSEAAQAGTNHLLITKAMQDSIDRARESWIQGDAAAFAALFAAQGEFIVPGDRWVGPEAIRQVAADFATNSANVAIEIRRIFIAGNQALVEWHWEDTEKSTGKRNRADDAIVIDFTGDQISRWREYIDTQTPAQ